MQIICLLSFFKVNNIQKKLFQRELNSKSYSLLRGVYVTNCYFLIFFCHFALKFTFFWNQQFLMFSGNLTRIFHEAIPSIYFILFKKQYFCVFWNVSFTQNIFDCVHIWLYTWFSWSALKFNSLNALFWLFLIWFKLWFLLWPHTWQAYLICGSKTEKGLFLVSHWLHNV